MVKRKIKYKNFVIALIAAAVLFFGGLFLGNQLTSLQVRDIETFQEELKISLASLELRHTLLKKNICDVPSFGEFGEELGNLERKLSSLEVRYGKGGNTSILKLKEPYFLLEIRHYLLMQEAKDRCGVDFDLILYFYSNDQEQCEECGDQGYVLSYLQDKVGYEKIKMYSFDIRSESPSVKTLMDLYGVEGAPWVVINGVSYNKLLSLEEIKEIIE